MPNRKTVLYADLRSRGWRPEKHFREYTMGELEQEAHTHAPDLMVEEYNEPPATQVEWQEPEPQPEPETPQPARVATPDPEELPGQRLNTKDEDEVIRVDEQGRQWLQEEFKKPAYPKPRGRRVLTYLDPGVKQETVKNGEYVETFEVAGDRASKPSEVKITLPSYQVGIYKDPRFPFKIHCYNGREGFNLHDVHEFYGGAELVPYGVKRIYIENDLCYDIRSVVQAINAEYRQMQLTGRAQ